MNAISLREPVYYDTVTKRLAARGARDTDAGSQILLGVGWFSVSPFRTFRDIKDFTRDMTFFFLSNL